MRVLRLEARGRLPAQDCTLGESAGGESEQNTSDGHQTPLFQLPQLIVA